MIGRRDYKNAVNAYWTGLSHNIEKLNQAIKNGEDYISLKDQIKGNVDYFGKLVEKVFNYQARVTMNANMRNLLDSLFQALDLIKTNQDPAAVTAQTASTIIPSITQHLQTIGAWPVEATTPLFLNMWTGWLDEGTAIMAGKNNDFDAAKKVAYDNASAFSNAYYNGVLNRFPELFI